MKHCVCALKGNNTPHDEAELTLSTIESCKGKLPGINLIKPDYSSDAENIHLFLTEHLPAKTLKELKKLFNPKYLHATIDKGSI